MDEAGLEILHRGDAARAGGPASATRRWLQRMVRRAWSVQAIENGFAQWQHGIMSYDKDKVDEMVLALLFLTLHDAGRAWKGHDWDALGRLHKKE